MAVSASYNDFEKEKSQVGIWRQFLCVVYNWADSENGRSAFINLNSLVFLNFISQIASTGDPAVNRAFFVWILKVYAALVVL
jgi:hypothetical protein